MLEERNPKISPQGNPRVNFHAICPLPATVLANFTVPLSSRPFILGHVTLERYSKPSPPPFSAVVLTVIGGDRSRQPLIIIHRITQCPSCDIDFTTTSKHSSSLPSLLFLVTFAARTEWYSNKTCSSVSSKTRGEGRGRGGQMSFFFSRRLDTKWKRKGRCDLYGDPKFENFCANTRQGNCYCVEIRLVILENCTIVDAFGER